jgi:hypothetical protein
VDGMGRVCSINKDKGIPYIILIEQLEKGDE